MRNKRMLYLIKILSILLIPVLAIGLFSGCEPDEPFEGVEFIDRYDYVYFPLKVDYKRGEVLGQALNEDYNKHELYYEVEGVDPDVMVYLKRGSREGIFAPDDQGLFYNPEKIDLLLEGFQPSGMMLEVRASQFSEAENKRYVYTHNVWVVTQEVWDAWKDAYQALIVAIRNWDTSQYNQKQLLYQELEKRILVVEQSVINDFCREFFLQKMKGEHYSSSDLSLVDEYGMNWCIDLKLQHYQKKGTHSSDYPVCNVNARLFQNRKKWFWSYDPLDLGAYALPLGEGTEDYLTSLMRDVSNRVKEGNTPDSGELFDFWSEYFPEDKLPPVFTFPGLGDLAPET